MNTPAGPCLNYDIVELILNSNDHWWSCDLVNLSLISTIWLEPVRRRLYANPRLTTFRACSHLARTLNEQPSLLDHIKGVELCPVARGEDGGSGSDRNGIRTILGIIGLKSITIGGELAHCANRFLHTITDLESVEEVHIDGRALESSPLCGHIASLEWDELISFGFPNLKKLRLTSLELEIMPLPFEGSNVSICELSLDDVTIPMGTLSNIFNEDSSLRKLCLRTQCQMETNEFIRDALTCCNLQELQYEVFAESSSELTVFDEDLPNLTSLRSLHVLGVNTDQEFLEAVGQRCSGLEELIIAGRGVTIPPQRWASFIESGSLTALKRLGLPWGTKHPPYTRWSASIVDSIRSAAAGRNIRLLEEHRV